MSRVEVDRPGAGRRLALVAAVGVSGIAIWLAASFTRQPPPLAAQARGVAVTNDAVSLAPDAPPL